VNIQQLFLLGMKRDLPELIPAGPRAVNLGAGSHHIPNAVPLDLPGWDAMHNPLPYPPESIDTFYAFHFLEHLPGDIVIRLLREMEEALRPGGVVNVVVPHRLGAMAFQDLDHRSFWTEDSWAVLFKNPHYQKNREVPWRLRPRFNLIMGQTERNLALFTQLVKDPAP